MPDGLKCLRERNGQAGTQPETRQWKSAGKGSESSGYKNGDKFEDTVEHQFRLLAQLRFTRQYQTSETNLYGRTSRVDFVLWNLMLYPQGLYIECKFQTVPGTADEKIPFLLWNIKQFYSRPTIIVFGGNDSLRPAMDIARKHIEAGSLEYVFKDLEFYEWLRRQPLNPERSQKLLDFH